MGTVKHINKLRGCETDAKKLTSLLERNEDGSKNFDCQPLTATVHPERIERGDLKDQIEKLFATPSDVALFYFSGHGYIDGNGGYLLGSDAKRGDDGISLFEILNYANGSKAKNVIMLLDSCHSGNLGAVTGMPATANLADGVTVLTASTADQYAIDTENGGVFTNLLVDALQGSAANLTGDITPGSIYAHIDQSLGMWEQRPVFKSNVTRFVSLRKTKAPIELENLKKITTFFLNPDDEFALDPTYEEEMKGRDEGMPLPIPAHSEIFKVLQKYNRLNLLVPVGVDNMWHAAMGSKSCRLTELGKHYHRLVKKNRI